MKSYEGCYAMSLESTWILMGDYYPLSSLTAQEFCLWVSSSPLHHPVAPILLQTLWWKMRLIGTCFLAPVVQLFDLQYTRAFLCFPSFQLPLLKSSSNNCPFLFFCFPPFQQLALNQQLALCSPLLIEMFSSLVPLRSTWLSSRAHSPASCMALPPPSRSPLPSSLVVLFSGIAFPFSSSVSILCRCLPPPGSESTLFPNSQTHISYCVLDVSSVMSSTS